MSESNTPLPESEIARRLAALPGWERDGSIIRKTYRMSSYPAGLAFASAIGTICEGFDHHPDQLCIGWQQVEVSFTTHSAGDALTALDFEVAAAIEALPYRRP
ncbi:MAG: 4a-hydroxytetrahydrobiopterin dehydratase [Anaerolineae bacterium]|nr:4a-hydroxytetrahydrobiopterin dehydratase [Anaerolineae bacterium]